MAVAMAPVTAMVASAVAAVAAAAAVSAAASVVSTAALVAAAGLITGAVAPAQTTAAVPATVAGADHFLHSSIGTDWQKCNGMHEHQQKEDFRDLAATSKRTTSKPLHNCCHWREDSLPSTHRRQASPTPHKTLEHPLHTHIHTSISYNLTQRSSTVFLLNYHVLYKTSTNCLLWY